MNRIENIERADGSHSRALVVVAWVTILTVSLPNIILREVFHLVPSEAFRIALPVAVTLAGLALTFLWRSVRQLRGFFIVLVVSQWFVYTIITQLPFL